MQVWEDGAEGRQAPPAAPADAPLTSPGPEKGAPRPIRPCGDSGHSGRAAGVEARAQGTRGSRLWPCGQWGLGDLALTAALSAKFGGHPDPDWGPSCAVVRPPSTPVAVATFCPWPPEPSWSKVAALGALPMS